MASSYTRRTKAELDVAHEELESAQILLESGKFRTSVGRSYYTMFHTAKAALSNKGVETKTHRGTIGKFGLEFIKSGFVEELYSKALSFAMDERLAADYETATVFSGEEASGALEKAKDFVDRVERLLEES
jgi:uncharacterized protein